MSTSELATVTKVTRVTHHDEARTEADIVHLVYDGKFYVWETEPDVYGVGHKVSVDPPVTPDANITWRGGDPSTPETRSER